MGEQVLCGSVYLYILTICHYGRIHSWHFQICWIGEYWWIRMLKISSRCYSPIYVGISENVDEDSVFAYAQLFTENSHMCGSSLKINSCNYSSIYARTSENVDDYTVFAYSRLFSKNWHMCGSGLKRKWFYYHVVTIIKKLETKNR